jgi:hypothetical protein
LDPSDSERPNDKCKENTKQTKLPQRQYLLLGFWWVLTPKPKLEPFGHSRAVADTGRSITTVMEQIMASQEVPSAFLFYTPDANRQQGHFMPHPHPFQHVQPPLHHHMNVFPAVPTLPSNHGYSRPNSAGSQVQMNASKMFAGAPSMLTPLASPQPLTHLKPAMALDTGVCDSDSLYYPSTPPLSSSGSAISSPGSCYDMLQTPLNPMFSGLEAVQGKAACRMDGLPESFPDLPDWSQQVSSPPMTPGMHPHPLDFRLLLLLRMEGGNAGGTYIVVQSRP